MRHPVFGPRVIVKRDSESASGRGCALYAAHFQPRIAAIVSAACAAAPLHTQEVWLTEGYRNIRETLDFHEEGLALDITGRGIQGTLLTALEYDGMVERMRIALGPDYDVLAHGDGPSRHIHVELDRRPG